MKLTFLLLFGVLVSCLITVDGRKHTSKKECVGMFKTCLSRESSYRKDPKTGARCCALGAKICRVQASYCKLPLCSRWYKKCMCGLGFSQDYYC